MELAQSRFPFNGGNIVASMTFPSFGQNFKDGSVIHVELSNKLIEAVQVFSKSI